MPTRWVPFLVAVAALAVGVIALARSSADVLDATEADELGGAVLRLNVLVSQAAVAALVLGLAWATAVPWTALGWHGVSVPALGLGLAVGAVLAVANELLDRLVDEKTLGRSAALRSRLAPETPAGWATLLLAVIPVIALSEELLFRGALIGAAAVGLGVGPWLLAVVSSVAFGLAHAAQGAVGVLGTAAFGLVLAATFLLTGDLLAVVIAHALVDVVEFGVHEGFGAAPGGPP